VAAVIDDGGGVHDANDAEGLEFDDVFARAGVVDVDDARIRAVTAREELAVAGDAESARGTGVLVVAILFVRQRPTGDGFVSLQIARLDSPVSRFGEQHVVDDAHAFHGETGLNVASGNALDFCETAPERFHLRATPSA